MAQPVPHEVLGGPDSRFVCPLVMDRFLKTQSEFSYVSRFRSMSFRSARRSDVEILSEAHSAVVKETTEEILQTIQFDLPTTLVARSASVIDWSDPRKKLPWGGLKLFQARIESSSGDRHDLYYASGELFWGTGSRPAVITGGIRINSGASLLVHCIPRIPDLEVNLGFWTVEQYQVRGRYV